MKEFGNLLEELLKETTLFPGENILFEVFFNPASGVLSSHKKHNELLQSMKGLSHRYEGELEYAKSAPARSIEVNMHQTQSRSQSLKAILKGVDRLTKVAESCRPVLVLAGGDGFHKDCITEIIQRNSADLGKFILYRLPLGTGNDTPLETDVAKALNILFTQNDEKKDSLISVSAKGRERDYALNVTSFGLDAYVGLFTEKWKGKISGDIYKVLVDFAALFYDFYHRTRISTITVFPSEKKRPPVYIKKRVFLNVFGRKGHTTYGGDKKILPGSENLMVTGYFHIPGRIMLKGMFMKGTHTKLKRVDFFNSDKMILDYPVPLLMELDGEVTHLKRDNFPVTIERLPHWLRVLN